MQVTLAEFPWALMTLVRAEFASTFSDKHSRFNIYVNALSSGSKVMAFMNEVLVFQQKWDPTLPV